MDNAGWITGPALEVVRALAGYTGEYSTYSPYNNGVILPGDEVLIDSGFGPKFVGVVIVSRDGALRIGRQSDGFQQFWWWDHVVGWRRPRG